VDFILSVARAQPPTNHMKIQCEGQKPRLALQCAMLLIGGEQTTRAASCGRRHAGVSSMQNLLWIGLVLGLLAVSLGYVRLCDNA